jgi:hypothetical protein
MELYYFSDEEYSKHLQTGQMTSRGSISVKVGLCCCYVSLSLFLSSALISLSFFL